MPELPVGTATFLFTDIEGSTRLFEKAPSAYRLAVARHHAFLQDTVAAHGGQVFKTVGDAVCAVFSRPSAALAAARDAQLALQAVPWNEVVAGTAGRLWVRMGLHTGEVELYGGEYVSRTLHRCARLMAAAAGGQVVLSSVTADLVQDDLPEGVSLADLGQQRLKDLERPEHIFQLRHSKLRADFPPLRTLEGRSHNLPIQLTPFLGRERELGEVRSQILQPQKRLLVLTGPGGTGKTRLAIQVAAELIDEFDHGVCFVPLAPVSDPSLVLATISQRLGVREAEGRSMLESLQDYLRDKHLLLVLDNFEQVLPGGPLIVSLLAGCPRLKTVVTSRAVLRVSGEHDFLVPPLSLPDRAHAPEPQQLARYEATLLFIERARAADPDFAITSENAAAALEICHRLDGLPLAIELAAARVRLLPPQALVTRLDHRLALLTAGARDQPARHQTLRGAIAWSYDLLERMEQLLFRRLAVFAGGCRLEAAEAVCRTAADVDLNVLDGAASLVDKSLLRREGPAGEPKLVMLETIREYAAEQLEASGEAPEIRRRHAAFYVGLAEEVEPKLWQAEQVEWLDRLEAELDNLRAVLMWSRTDPGGAEMGLRLARSLWWFWYLHGHMTEGRSWLEELLSRSGPLPASARADALLGTGFLAYGRGDLAQAATLLQESLALAREADNQRTVARALLFLAFTVRNQGDPGRARMLSEESLMLCRRIDYKWGIAFSLLQLAYAARDAGDHDRVPDLAEESLTLFRQLGERLGTAYSLATVAEVALRAGDYGRATVLLEESLARSRELGNKRGIGFALAGLGEVAERQGDYDRAAALYAETLVPWRELGNKWGVAGGLEGLASTACAQGHVERAARLFGVADALRKAVGTPIPSAQRATHEQRLGAIRAELGEQRFAKAWAQGQAMSLEEVLSYAVEAPIGAVPAASATRA